MVSPAAMHSLFRASLEARRLVLGEGHQSEQYVEVTFSSWDRKQEKQCEPDLRDALQADRESTANNVFTSTVYLKDMADFPKVNKVYEEHMPNPKSARTCIQAGGLPVGAVVEMDCVATY